MRTKIIGILSLLALASCGGGASSETTTETTTSDTGGETAARPAWDDMDHEQRVQFMAEVVVPAMRPIFQEVDAERFADFGCPTCHGANGREVNMQMPNGIAPLDRNQMQALFTSDQPLAVAMRERVWPQMGQLIGEELYDPETHEGFSCFDCHADGTPAAK